MPTGADFLDNTAAFLGQKAASADVVSGGRGGGVEVFSDKAQKYRKRVFYGKVPLSRCANKAI